LTYLLVDSQDRNRLTQAGLDFRLDGRQMWDAPVDVSVDVRSRRTNFERSVGAGTSDDLTRVYRLNLSAHDRAGRYVVTLGRQSSSALSLVSIFDGALVESRGASWNSGLFLGAQPEPIRLGASSSIVELGGYLEWHQPEASEKRWSVSSGVVSSRQDGATNRDFGYTLIYYNNRDFSVSASQEIDVNRGWKRDLGEPLLSPTSSYATLNMKVVPNLSVRAGYDNRRSVRLYRDYISPETEFDDRYRQGGWAGLALEQVTHLRVGADVRTNAIGGADRVTTWSGNAEVVRLGQTNGALHLRLSRASGIGISTSLATYGFGLDPLSGCHVELGGGARNTRNDRFQLQDDSRWLSAGMDLTLLRRGYFNWTLERYSGGLSPGTQMTSGLSWRF
jgi:hypothetical protein